MEGKTLVKGFLCSGAAWNATEIDPPDASSSSQSWTRFSRVEGIPFVHPSLELLCRSSASGKAIPLEFSKFSSIFSLNLFVMNIKESPEYTDRFSLSQFSPSSGS